MLTDFGPALGQWYAPKLLHWSDADRIGQGNLGRAGILLSFQGFVLVLTSFSQATAPPQKVHKFSHASGRVLTVISRSMALLL
jgi:hypothetical protein